MEGKIRRGGIMKKAKEEREQTRARSWPFILVFFAFTVACIVFGILCIDGATIAFVQNFNTLFTVLWVLLSCILCGICIWLVIAAKDTWVKTFISVYVLLLFCLVLIFIFQRTGFFEVINSSEKLQSYLEKAGAWMPIAYIVLQYLQVILLPIPSVVSTVAGVALFGPFKTMLFSLLGILPASVTAFFIGRKLGNKAVSWIVGEETLNKWQNKLKGKDNLLLTIMFVLPMFPDDVLCFIAGLSSMSTKYFLIMILISRVLAIAGTCYSFEFIPLNTWWGLLIWGIFIVAIVAAFILVYKNMDRLQTWLTRMKKRRKKKE